MGGDVVLDLGLDLDLDLDLDLRLDLRLLPVTVGAAGLEWACSCWTGLAIVVITQVNMA